MCECIIYHHLVVVNTVQNRGSMYCKYVCLGIYVCTYVVMHILYIHMYILAHEQGLTAVSSQRQEVEHRRSHLAPDCLSQAITNSRTSSCEYIYSMYTCMHSMYIHYDIYCEENS